MFSLRYALCMLVFLGCNAMEERALSCSELEFAWLMHVQHCCEDVQNICRSDDLDRLIINMSSFYQQIPIIIPNFFCRDKLQVAYARFIVAAAVQRFYLDHAFSEVNFLEGRDEFQRHVNDGADIVPCSVCGQCVVLSV